MISWYLLLLLSSFLIHLQVVFSCNWLGLLTIGYSPLFLFKGVSYLFYPLCGWIAEVFFTRFRMIKWSFIAMLISSIMISISGILFIVTTKAFVFKSYPVYSGMVFIMTGLFGLGIYEANAIQFGMDQMLESSSEQLSSFIHWHFWCVHIGPLITYYAIVGTVYFLDCFFDADDTFNTFNHLLSWILIALSCFQIVIAVCGILLSFMAKKYLRVEESSKNPLRIAIKVVIYSLKHKHPERRSAFTYWENDIPSRIDLGKEKYGGPFTYEQVEDVKTMFGLLLLIVSLIGYHLSGDGYSLTFYIMNTVGCPTSVPFIGMVLNPEHIITLVVVFCIPIYHFMKKYLLRNSPSLLTRLWIGLFLCLVNESIQCIYSNFLKQRQFLCPKIVAFDNPPLLLKCTVSNIRVHRNNSCEYFCTTSPINDPLVYLSLVPLILNGLSYLLVFVTTVEFICAQSPNAMKGFLIGVWYSMLSVKYMVVYILDTRMFLKDVSEWNLYHGIKGACIFISIIIFSSICKHYQYRRRDEIVNEQAIIEEQYERELLLNSSSSLEHS